MDILINTQDFPPERGGIQTYILELAKSLLKLGHTVRIICPGKKSDPNPIPELKELIRFNIHSSWLFLPLMGYLPRYLKANPSITHILHAQWQGGIAELLIPNSKRKHKSYCLVLGRELLTSVLGPLAPWLRKKVFHKMTAAFPCSREILNLAATKAHEGFPFELLYPGVDTEQFYPFDTNALKKKLGFENNRIVFCIARMVARKNIRRIIESMPKVLESVPDAILLLGGSGPEKEDLEKCVADLNLKSKVHFLGRIPDADMAAYYNMADIYVLPSFSTPKDIEGFGIVFLEAGACETPVIGSTSGGIPDAVEAEKSGLLVPPESTEKLQEAIVELLLTPERSKEMGQYARKRILQSFTWDHTGERFISLMNATHFPHQK